MMRPTFSLLGVWAIGACFPLAAAPLSSPPTQLPPGCKAALRFLKPRVAAGAIANSSHQSQFEVLITDEKNKPKSDVPVSLPIIVKGGRAGEDNEPLSARLQWLGGAGAGKTAEQAKIWAQTDAQGVARGLFTSGNRTEKTMIQLRVGEKGGPTAEIAQAWNEYDDEKRWDEESLEEGTGSRLLYKMRYRRKIEGFDAENEQNEDNLVPITGHKMTIVLTKVTINIWHADEGPDEDNDGMPDGRTEEKTVSSEDADKTDWNYFVKFAEFTPVHEVADGNYATVLRFNTPKKPDGEPELDFSTWSYEITDECVFDEED